MNEGNIIEVNNVSLQFRLYKEQVSDLKEYLVRKVQGNLETDEFWALKDVSFNVKRGEAVALVGKNGSGKSTMLKVVAGIIRPTFGKVAVGGTIAPMIELGAGFDFDMTARENVLLNGAILGYPEDFLKEKVDDIMEFAELQDFVDVPIKNFSSGMITRLGFAIATVVTPDVLIVDEILSVGDFRFQNKCEQRIAEMRAQGTTLLLVSHSMEQVKRICDRAILMYKGNMLIQSDVDTVCDLYMRM